MEVEATDFDLRVPLDHLGGSANGWIFAVYLSPNIAKKSFHPSDRQGVV